LRFHLCPCAAMWRHHGMLKLKMLPDLRFFAHESDTVSISRCNLASTSALLVYSRCHIWPLSVKRWTLAPKFKIWSNLRFSPRMSTLGLYMDQGAISHGKTHRVQSRQIGDWVDTASQKYKIWSKSWFFVSKGDSVY